MSAIYEKNNRYERWLPLVNRIYRSSFRHLEYVHPERIPDDGAVIFAPNHCNALLDALAILAIDNTRKVFVSRADIFRKPRLAKLLRWLKIMPIRRIRDGIDEVRKNDATMEEAIETLRHRVPFCIMPEGTHRPSYELMPLKKGIFRIAFAADDAFNRTEQGRTLPVYIVPVHLHYGSFTHLWTNLSVHFGEPIDITQYANEHTSMSRPEQILALLQNLSNSLQHMADDCCAEEHAETSGTGKTSRTSGTATLLLLLAPLFFICFLLTLPQQAAKLIIRRRVKDPCFRNSVLYVVWLLSFLLSCGLLYLPVIGVEEYLYQLRKIV